MKLIRSTTIEKFNRFLRESSEYDTEEALINQITGQFKGNAYTYTGSAFHKIVEGDWSGIHKVPDNMGGGRIIDVGAPVIFDTNQCKVALDYRNTMPNAIHEIRDVMEISGAMVTGEADIIDGFEIHDIKTKYSPIHYEDYDNSYQWRIYLQLFGCEIFHFDLFSFVGYDVEHNGLDVRGLPLVQQTPPITCYAYPSMYADTENMVMEFLKWAKFRDVYDALPDYNENEFELLKGNTKWN